MYSAAGSLEVKTGDNLEISKTPSPTFDKSLPSTGTSIVPTNVAYPVAQAVTNYGQ